MSRGPASAFVVLVALTLAGLMLVATRGRLASFGPEGVGFERPDWSREAPSEVTTVRTRRAASLGVLIPASLLLVLYVYRAKRYLLWWVAAWAFTGGMTYFGAEGADFLRLAAETRSSPTTGRLITALSQFSCVAAAVAMLGGMRIFYGAAAVPQAGRVALPLLAVMLPALAVGAGAHSALIAGYSVGGAVMAAAAATCALIVRRQRISGALLTTFGLGGVAANYLIAGALVVSEQAGVEMPNQLIASNAIASSVVAFGMFAMTFQQMTSELRHTNEQLARAQAELEALAVTDPLTGCYNRRFFDEVVARELEQHRRFGMRMSILFIDCDRFKSINDRLGHETGDKVLTSVAALIRAEVRESDYVFRWGGDEFVVLMTCDERQAAIKASTIRSAFSTSDLAATLPPGTGLSVGWIGVPVGARDLLPFVQAADRRMYERRREPA